jgi:hypothetical protein
MLKELKWKENIRKSYQITLKKLAKETIIVKTTDVP